MSKLPRVTYTYQYLEPETRLRVFVDEQLEGLTDVQYRNWWKNERDWMLNKLSCYSNMNSLFDDSCRHIMTLLMHKADGEEETARFEIYGKIHDFVFDRFMDEDKRKETWPFTLRVVTVTQESENVFRPMGISETVFPEASIEDACDAIVEVFLEQSGKIKWVPYELKVESMDGKVDVTRQMEEYLKQHKILRVRI